MSETFDEWFAGLDDDARERLKARLLAENEAESRPTPMERLRRAYGAEEGADALASGAAVRDRRRNKGGGDDDDAAA